MSDGVGATPAHPWVDAIDEAVAAIRDRCAIEPRVGIVLGSGLGGLVASVDVEATIPYRDLPHFPISTVTGHAGAFILGRLGPTPVALMSGRVHLYEGYPAHQVVFPVRVLAKVLDSSGPRTVVVTNAAGGINADFRPRDVMVIRDHLNLTGQNPLVGLNPAALGPRFPDMTEAYSSELVAKVHGIAEQQGFQLREGVYAGLLGPSYETPAEIRMLKTLGADAVGMSTVLEVVALRHMGVRVLGLSCITNLAAGMAGAPLSHDDVKTEALEMQARVTRLVAETVQSLTP